jgi:two-component system response regulator
LSVSAVDILLVEDNPDDLELALLAFKDHRLSNHIQVARDGAEALECLFASDSPHFKVVLLDLKLPKIDGLEVLSRIRANERTKLYPVVVLTSSQEDRDLVRAYELGANSYIVKPVDFDGFKEAVGRVGLYWLLLNAPPVQSRQTISK